MKQIITGFHSIEERVKHFCETQKTEGVTIHFSKIGPRVKKILENARKGGISAVQSDDRKLDLLVQPLPEGGRDHRGIVMVVEGENAVQNQNSVEFDGWINSKKLTKDTDESRSTVIILDSITDPHNVGAIIRSCDQFGADLAVMPARRGSNDFSDNEIIGRTSAGAASYVPVSVVTNLVRTVQKLKEAGYWIYGADAGGESVQKVKFPPRTAIVMGSEGTGISKLLEEQCDSIVSIPTCGKIDSLNVSVAAGVLLYEIYRQSL